MKDRLSKLAILVVNYRYDLRDDNDPIEAGKDEEVAAVFRDFPGLVSSSGSQIKRMKMSTGESIYLKTMPRWRHSWRRQF